MLESEKARFGVIIGAVFESFGQESTPPRLMGYWLGLKDLELAAVEKAAGRALREMTRLPAPAELRKLAGEMTSQDRALAAWGDVLNAVPVGCYRHVDFQDKLCNAAIRMLGGWPTFLERFSGAETEKWARLDFLRVYQSIADSGVSGDVCGPLAGLLEVQVSNGKLTRPVPVLIATDEKRIGLPASCAVAIESNKSSDRIRLELKKADSL